MSDTVHACPHRGLEGNLLIEASGRRIALEAKSGATIADDFFAPLEKLHTLMPDIRAGIVYGGNSTQRRNGMLTSPRQEIQRLLGEI